MTNIKKNGVRNHDLFEEFASFIDTLASRTGHLILLGNFNIHWDIRDELNTKKLVELLASSNLTQHVHKSTHTLGHIIKAFRLFFLTKCLNAFRP